MMKSDRNKQVFNVDACTRCGECFHQCPELSLPLSVARQEIDALIEGKSSKHVLAHCTTCFSCNHYCPHDCKPYQLILERWNDLYKRRGAPPIYRFVCPTMDGSIWHMLDCLMNREELAWTREWMNQKPEKTVLLIGNYVHLFPFVAGNSRLLDFFSPVDLIDHWECGAYLYQGGYLDEVKRIAEKCKSDFDHWKVDAVVPMIDAVHWMMTGVYPDEMNTPIDLEVINFHDWMLDKMDSGGIVLSNPLDLSVTVHDNCYSKAGGGRYWDKPREILRRCGCNITEMAHIRENSLCCGFGAAASWVRPHTILFDVMAVAEKKFREAEATGAKALVSYCGGCLYLLWAARELYDSSLEVYHLAEVVRMAMGERLPYPEAHVRRAWDIIAIMTWHLAVSLVSRPFKIREVSFSERRPSPKSFRMLRLIRRMLDIPAVRNLYRRIFRLMVPMLKSKRRNFQGT